MSGLSLSNKVLDKYFGFLLRLDADTKKNIIDRLKNSIKPKPKKKFDLSSIYGAWEDERTSDEIIEYIRASRVEKTDGVAFE